MLPLKILPPLHLKRAQGERSLDFQLDTSEEEKKEIETDAQDATSVTPMSVATQQMQAAAAVSIPRGVEEQREWSRNTTGTPSGLKRPPVNGGTRGTYSRRNMSNGGHLDNSLLRKSRRRRVRPVRTSPAESASEAAGRGMRARVPRSPPLPRLLSRIPAAKRVGSFVRKEVMFESPVGAERERRGQDDGVDSILVAPTMMRFGGSKAHGGSAREALSSVARSPANGAGVSPTEMNSDGSGGEGEDSLREVLSNVPPSDRYVSWRAPEHRCAQGCASAGVQRGLRGLRLEEEGHKDDDSLRSGFDSEGEESTMKYDGDKRKRG